jgi:hypothetical protein
MPIPCACSSSRLLPSLSCGGRPGKRTGGPDDEMLVKVAFAPVAFDEKYAESVLAQVTLRCCVTIGVKRERIHGKREYIEGDFLVTSLE